MALPPGMAEWFSRTFKSSGLPAYQMSGPGLQAARSLKNRPVVNPEFMRPDYSGAGERARRFQEYQTGRDIPGANTDYSARVNSSPANLPAAERAYVAERDRVAQQVAQDPALSQYERNRAAAVAGGDQAKMNAVRDEGIRIWAEKNRELAKNVKPGQSGYEAIQGVLNQGAMGAPMDIPFNPASLLGSNAIESVPSYGGISDLQPVGTPLPRTQFDTPQNQAMAQMYNRFMTGPYAGSSQAPATNPAEATYATATNVQPIGDINLNAFSFNTPAEKRRGELFQRLLNNTLAVQ
jgi:hypothetical protein